MTVPIQRRNSTPNLPREVARPDGPQDEHVRSAGVLHRASPTPIAPRAQARQEAQTPEDASATRRRSSTGSRASSLRVKLPSPEAMRAPEAAGIGEAAPAEDPLPPDIVSREPHSEDDEVSPLPKFASPTVKLPGGKRPAKGAEPVEPAPPSRGERAQAAAGPSRAARPAASEPSERSLVLAVPSGGAAPSWMHGMPPLPPLGASRTLSVPGFGRMEVPVSDEVGKQLLQDLFPPTLSKSNGTKVRPTPLQANRIRALRKLAIPEGRDPVEFLTRHIMGSLANEFNVIEIDLVARAAAHVLHEEGFGDRKRFLDMLNDTQNVLDSMTGAAYGAVSATGFATWAALSDFPHFGNEFAHGVTASLQHHASPPVMATAVGAAAGVVGSLMDHSPGQAVAATFGQSFYTRPVAARLNVALAIAQAPESLVGVALRTGVSAAAGYGGRNIASRLSGGLAMIAKGYSARTRSLYDGVNDAVGGPVAGATLRLVSMAIEKYDGRAGVQYLLGRDDLREMLQAYKQQKQAPARETARMVKERALALSGHLRNTPLINNELFTPDAWASHMILGAAFAQVLAVDAVLAEHPNERLINHQLGLIPWYFLWGAALEAVGSAGRTRPDLDALVHGKGKGKARVDEESLVAPRRRLGGGGSVSSHLGEAGPTLVATAASDVTPSDIERASTTTRPRSAISAGRPGLRVPGTPTTPGRGASSFEMLPLQASGAAVTGHLGDPGVRMVPTSSLYTGSEAGRPSFEARPPSRASRATWVAPSEAGSISAGRTPSREERASADAEASGSHGTPGAESLLQVPTASSRPEHRRTSSGDSKAVSFDGGAPESPHREASGATPQASEAGSISAGRTSSREEAGSAAAEASGSRPTPAAESLLQVPTASPRSRHGRTASTDSKTGSVEPKAPERTDEGG